MATTKVLGKLLVIGAVLGGTAHLASAQGAPAKLTVGIYTPSVEFGTAQARLAYVQGLAKAIEQNTGIKTEAQSYASIAALKKDNVDYAIVDGPCYAVNLGWTLMANANIGGSTTRTYALFSAAGDTMQSLKGKKLAFVATGCNDTGFIDNAMLESEVDATFFGARAPEKDLTGALASVTSYKTAQAVFAPNGSAKGLTKLFDTAAVPNPAFVEIGSKANGTITGKVSAAVIGYGGGGAIASWTKPSKDVYQSLQSRLGPAKKSGLFANADFVRVDSSNVLIDPTSLKDSAYVPVRHHFVRAPNARLEP